MVDAWCVRSASKLAKTTAEFCAPKSNCGKTESLVLVGGTDSISYLCTLDAVTALPVKPILNV